MHTYIHTYIHMYIHTHVRTYIHIYNDLRDPPVWEEAIPKTSNLVNLKRVQRLVNIKMAKAYTTVSFKASCVLAGVPPIGIVHRGKGETI
jgi:hypothetical protein